MNKHTYITDHSGNEYELQLMTRSLAKRHAAALLEIHNIIPYVRWNPDDLSADVSPKHVLYKQKWELSFVVFDKQRPIGLLVAYKRESSAAHPVEAIYIHRLAVDPKYQGRGIGGRLLKEALRYYSREFPDIANYTVQTNDETANEDVIRFYEAAGFERFAPVQYPDKLDILLKLESASLLALAAH